MALERPGVGLLAVLAAGQFTAWGLLYYVLPAIGQQIATDTGWSISFVTGTFSAAQILSAITGIWIGRTLDRTSPRPVMAGGAFLAAVALTMLGLIASPAGFILGWLLLGAAQSAVLYQPAFTIVNRLWEPADRGRALATVTVIGGLASTVWVPAAVATGQAAGWQATFLVFAAVCLTALLPLNLQLPSRWPTSPPTSAAEPPERTSTITVQARPFRRLQTASALTTAAIYLATINLIPLLASSGYPLAAAAGILALVGLGQVLGRLIAAPFLGASGAVSSGRAVAAVTAIAAAILTVTYQLPAVAIVLALLLGAARGLLTLVQATVVVEQWGPQHLGALQGRFAAPATIAAALAPVVGAITRDLTGSWQISLLLAAALALLGATSFPTRRALASSR